MQPTGGVGRDPKRQKLPDHRSQRASGAATTAPAPDDVDMPADLAVYFGEFGECGGVPSTDAFTATLDDATASYHTYWSDIREAPTQPVADTLDQRDSIADETEGDASPAGLDLEDLPDPQEPWPAAMHNLPVQGIYTFGHMSLLVLEGRAYELFMCGIPIPLAQEQLDVIGLLAAAGADANAAIEPAWPEPGSQQAAALEVVVQQLRGYPLQLDIQAPPEGGFTLAGHTPAFTQLVQPLHQAPRSPPRVDTRFQFPAAWAFIASLLTGSRGFQTTADLCHATGLDHNEVRRMMHAWNARLGYASISPTARLGQKGYRLTEEGAQRLGWPMAPRTTNSARWRE